MLSQRGSEEDAPLAEADQEVSRPAGSIEAASSGPRRNQTRLDRFLDDELSFDCERKRSASRRRNGGGRSGPC